MAAKKDGPGSKRNKAKGRSNVGRGRKQPSKAKKASPKLAKVTLEPTFYRGKVEHGTAGTPKLIIPYKTTTITKVDPKKKEISMETKEEFTSHIVHQIKLPMPENKGNARFGHHMKEYRNRQIYFDECQFAMGAQGLNYLRGKAFQKCVWTATFFTNHFSDADNLAARLKWPIDFIKDAGIIVDDGYKNFWPVIFPMQIKLKPGQKPELLLQLILPFGYDEEMTAMEIAKKIVAGKKDGYVFLA